MCLTSRIGDHSYFVTTCFWWVWPPWWETTHLLKRFCSISVSFQFCSVPWLIGSPGDMRDNSTDILFQSFLQEALMSSSCMGMDVHSFYVVHPVFPLPTISLPTLQGSLKYGFREAGLVCDVPKSYKFLSLTVVRRGSCTPTRELILLCTQLLVLWSK